VKTYTDEQVQKVRDALEKVRSANNAFTCDEALSLLDHPVTMEQVKPDCRVCMNHNENGCNSWLLGRVCVNGSLFELDTVFDPLWRTE
jgi:hypothetical protein